MEKPYPVYVMKPLGKVLVLYVALESVGIMEPALTDSLIKLFYVC